MVQARVSIDINIKHVRTVILIGQEVVSYESLQPTSGIHRLIFVLFGQQKRMSLPLQDGAKITS